MTGSAPSLQQYCTRHMLILRSDVLAPRLEKGTAANSRRSFLSFSFLLLSSRLDVVRRSPLDTFLGGGGDGVVLARGPPCLDVLVILCLVLATTRAVARPPTCRIRRGDRHATVVCAGPAGLRGG